MDESNEKELEAGMAHMMTRMEAQVARLRSVIDAIGSYTYEVKRVPPGPEGPRVIFVCRVCGAESRSWEPGIHHYGGCILGVHSLPVADAYADIPGCPRCEQDHYQISFFEFKNLKYDMVLDLEFTHWGMCPETHEPILFQKMADSAYYVDEPTEGDTYV